MPELPSSHTEQPFEMSTQDYLSRFNSPAEAVAILRGKFKEFGVNQVLENTSEDKDLQTKFLVAMGRRDDFAQYASGLFGNFPRINDGTISREGLNLFRFKDLENAKAFVKKYKEVIGSSQFQEYQSYFIKSQLETIVNTTLNELSRNPVFSNIPEEKYNALQAAIRGDVTNTLKSDIEKTIYYRMVFDHLYPLDSENRETRLSRLMIPSSIEYFGQIDRIYGIMRQEISDNKLPILFKPNVPPSIEFIRLHDFK